jgi:hypothetical protein
MTGSHAHSVSAPTRSVPGQGLEAANLTSSAPMRPHPLGTHDERARDARCRRGRAAPHRPEAGAAHRRPGLLRDAPAADVAYKLAYAKALLGAEGSTVAEREALATPAVEHELRERKTTEAVADAAKESVRSLRDQLSAVQSVNANVRHLRTVKAFCSQTRHRAR